MIELSACETKLGEENQEITSDSDQHSVSALKNASSPSSSSSSEKMNAAPPGGYEEMG